jgi:hypothetical protein
MVNDENAPRATFLKRWSARKRAVAAEADAAVPSKTIATPVVSSEAALPSTPLSASPAQIAAALPPVESLTFHSDFAAFMQPEVDETLRRSALKKLFNDPRFNVMDGLDTYIDDYSKEDPIAPDVVRGLVQARYIFDPPQTRINEQGFVEDVPPPAPEAPPPQDVDAIALASDDELPAVEPVTVDPAETPVQAELPLADPAATDPAERDEYRKHDERSR